MYDCNCFGNYDMYNPSLHNNKLAPYLVNTFINRMLYDVLIKTTRDFLDDYNHLIEYDEVKISVNMNMCYYEDVLSSSLWGLLVNAEYVTVKIIIDYLYILVISNNEV